MSVKHIFLKIFFYIFENSPQSLKKIVQSEALETLWDKAGYRLTIMHCGLLRDIVIIITVHYIYIVLFRTFKDALQRLNK